MNVSSFKDLLIWQKSKDIGIKLYKEMKYLPKIEQYALCDQMRRCIISVPSNIAEGHARNSNKEFIHFLSISRGSIAELQTQIIFCMELEYLDKETGEKFLYEYNGIDLMIKNFINSIKKNNPNIFKSLKSFLFSIFA